MDEKRGILSWLAMAGGTLFFFALVYLAWDADRIYLWLSDDVHFVAAPPCDLQRESCSAVLSDGTQLAFAITPRPIPTMQSLQFEVEAPGLSAPTLKVDVYGTQMNMGHYSYTLKRTPAGRYRAEGMIPTCTPGMEWRADLIVEAPARRYGTYFTFQTR